MSQPRTRQLHFRVTDSEMARIQQKMAQLGILSIGAYLRKMALDGYVIRLELPLLHRMAYLLQMCSNNLNQYTHEAHLSGYLYPQDVESLRCQLEELTDLARQILARLRILIVGDGCEGDIYGE